MKHYTPSLNPSGCYRTVTSAHFLQWLCLPLLLVSLLSLLSSSHLYAKENPNLIHVDDGPWDTDENAELTTQRFNIHHQRRQFFFAGYIEMTPTVTFHVGNDKTTYSIALNVSATLTGEKPLPGTYVWLGYRLARQVLDYPGQSVRSIEVQFDSGGSNTASSWRGDMPKGATRITSIKVRWYNGDIDMERILVWGGPGIPWKIIVGGGAAGVTAAGTALLYIRQRRRKRESQDDDRNELWSIRFFGMDLESEINELRPGQVVQLKVTKIKTSEQVETPDTPNKLSSITVTNVSSGGSVNLELAPEEPDSDTYISEILLLKWPTEKLELSDKNLALDYDEWLRATINEDQTSIPAETRPDSPLPELQGYSLERQGDGRRLQVNPDLNRDGALVVRFTHASGQPVAGEKIQWSIAKFPEAMLTATDEFGESSLSFAPMVGGRFAIMFDGLMLAEGLSAGNTTIIATPANELYTELMETKPIKFTVLLTPPTELTFLDSNYSAAPFLLDEQQYHLQAFLGGGGRGGIFRPEEIHTTLTHPNGDTVDIKLKRTARRWLYQTEELQQATVNNNGDPYVFSYLEKEIRLPVYDSAVNAQWLELKNVFDSYEQMLSSSITQGQLDPEHKTELQMKLAMVNNALAWHGADLHSKNINIAVLRKYTSLLTEEENLGEPINQAVDQAVLPLPAKGFQLNYVCEQERDQINDTINKAVAKQLTSFTELDAAFLIMLETVRFGLSIHIGAYVLVTGRTEEGRRASAYERLAGGAEVLLALIPVGMAIGRYAKASKAMRLQATAEKKLIDRTLGQAYEQGTFTLAAVTAKQLEKRFAKIYRESKKSSDRLLKRIDAIDKKTLQLRDDIKKRKTKLDETEAALKQMETQRGLAKAERTPGIRTTPGAIASKKRNIASQKKMLDKKIDTLDKLPAKHKEITDALDAIDAGRYLDRAELQRMHDASVLPGSHDQFENAAAWRLYEKQVEEALAQKNPLWAGDNKVFIRAPYVRTNWGKRFSINKKITTKHPEPDHLRIDPDSFAAGDSKFYTWPDKTSYGSLTRSEKRLIDKHVLTVVDTIEKARLCQFHVVKKTANNVGKPATTVWQTVFDLPMVIVTPTNVPDFVKQMIKTRVRGAGRGVVFTTLKPQLDLWADLIPKIVKAK